MKTFRKMLAITLVSVMAVLLMPAVNNWKVSAATEGWTAIGTCEWQLTGEGDNKTLTIRPLDNGESGTLPDFTEQKANNWPWYKNQALYKQITNVVIEDGVKAGNSLANMFGATNGVGYIVKTVDLSGLDITNVETMYQMFYSCSKLESIIWPANIDTSNVTNMKAIFANCVKLSAAKRIEYINKLLDTNDGKCTNWTYGLFQNCTDESIDLSTLDTSNVTDMKSMFDGCTSLKTINLSGLDTSKVTDMSYMFQKCQSLKMLDLSGFNTSKVELMNYMFNSCSSLETICVGEGWKTDAVTTKNNMMFSKCSSLIGGEGTSLEQNGTTNLALARVDGGSEAPGYLTSVDQYLAYNTIYLKDGKAFSTYDVDTDTCSNNITAAVATKGLSYNSDTSTWEMKNFNFITTAPTAIYFLDNTSILDVSGTNNIEINSKKDINGIIAFNLTIKGKSLSDILSITTKQGVGESTGICVFYLTLDTLTLNSDVYNKSEVATGSRVLNLSVNNAKFYTCAKSDGDEGCDDFGLALMTPDSTIKITGSGEVSSRVFGINESGDEIQCSGGAYAVKSSVINAPSVIAKDTVNKSDLTWGVVGQDVEGYLYGYLIGSDVATDITLTAPKITAGEQTGTLTYGTDGTATYTVKVEGISEPEKFDVTWYDKDGTPLEYPLAGVTVSYDAQTDTFTVETEDITPVGTYMFTLTSGDVTSDKATLTVGQKELTVTGTTVADKVYDGTTETTVKAGTLTGMVEGQNVQIDTATAAFEDKDAGEDKNVTVKYTLKGDDAGNYTISDETFTAEISKLSLTVDGTSADGKDYDGTTDAVIGTMGALTGAVNGDDVSIDTDKCEASFATKDVGNGIDVTVKYALKGADAGNYTVSDSTTGADIEKKAITVKPDADQSTEYMYADPVLTYTYSGNADGETPVFEGALTRAAGDDVTAEGYAIGLGTLALKDNGTFKASNYELELDKTTVYFFVTKAKIDLPVAAENLIYTGNEQYGISTIFGAPYSVTGTKSATDAGKYTVTAELTDKDNFEWNIETPTSEDQQIEWEIAKRSITLTSGSASKIADDEPLTCEEVTVSGDGFVAGEGFEYTVTGSQTKVGESKNTFTYTAKSGTNADNYDVTKVEGTLTVDKLPEIIGGAGQTIDLGKAEGAEFVSDASFDKFVKVTVDGNDVDAKYYTAVSGSTKVTLTKEYLQTLSAGKHTLGIVSTTGTAETEFTVTEKAPNTGDSSNVLLYSAVALFSLAGAFLLRKKKFSV